jgi:two-component system, cell cycle response regulator DivK
MPVVPKIMVVEDNEINLKLFNDLLKAQGYEVVATQDGTVAVELARATRPDLVLMDVNLPKISGLAIMALMKADDDLKSIPIVAVTACAMKGDEEKIRAAGCEDYVAKPISIPDFLRVVKTYLNR